jgi:transposase
MTLACQYGRRSWRVRPAVAALTWENMVMGQNFVTAERDQLFLLPPDARDWLPGRHLAWAVLEAAGQLDMAPFTAWYRADGQGRPAYHPRLMAGLVMYCYCKGVRSSRAIEMATWDDVGARVICGNLHPDHATVHRFITRHERAVKGLLVASLVACAKQGLVSVDVVAGDGTKVKASASMAAGATAEQLEIEIAELEALLAAEVAAWFAQAQAADAAEDALFGDGDGDGDASSGPGGGAMTLARLTDKIVRRQKARARLDADAAARQAEAAAARQDKIARLQARVAARRADAGRVADQADARAADYQRRHPRPRGRVPVPADRHIMVRRARQAVAAAEQALAAARAAPAAPEPPARPPKANTTDPASRVMPAKRGGFGQSHNMQILAGKHQVIYAITAHGNPTDTAALHPLLAKARANLDTAGIADPIGTALFDAGYASDANFTTECEPDLYVAITKEARQTGRLRGARKPATMKDSWQQMADRLDTPEGKALYRRRAGIIEPVFAQLFSRLGRDLHYRDTKVDLELHLWAASHNLLKALRAQARLAPAGPPPAHART